MHLAGKIIKVLALTMGAIYAASPAEGVPPTPSRPNILFAIADDWSYGHASAYGCRWVKTPGFDRVAKEGLLFTRAYTPNAKCAPSRASILTGRNPWQLKAAANHNGYFPAEFKTFVEALGDQGYFAGMTHKGWAPGVARDASGKLREMAGKPFNRRTARALTSQISGNDYAGNFEDFLEAAPANQSWCFWYGAGEPHRGYEYGSGVSKGGKQLADIERVPGCWPDNETVRNDMLDYALEVEHFDRHLARMLDSLEQRGMLGNTVIIATSDNGMPFPHDKGQAYHDANHLPLAILWKAGIRFPGRSVEDYVSFIDFAPTFIELAGVRWEQTGMAPATGRSLRGIFSAPIPGLRDPGRDHVLIGKERNDVGRPNDGGYPIRGIIRDDRLYLHNFESTRWPGCNPETGYLDCDGGPTKTEVLKARTIPGQKHFWDLCFGKRPQEELYDLKQDPDCVANLAGRAESRVPQESLRQQLFDELKKQQDPRILGQEHFFDGFPSLQHGFYERFMKGEKPAAGWINESDYEKQPLE